MLIGMLKTPKKKQGKKKMKEKTEFSGNVRFRKVLVELVTTEEMLGMSPGTKELYQNFLRIQKDKAIKKIVTKIRRDMTAEEKKKLEEMEIAEVEKVFSNPAEANAVAEEIEAINQLRKDGESKITCFLRSSVDQTQPIFGDWQIKGAAKDFWRGLIKSSPSAKVYGFIDLIETQFQVFPESYKLPPSGMLSWMDLNELHRANADMIRKELPIIMPEGFKLDGTERTLCERTLRAQTPQGERIAIACSEAIPAGAKVRFVGALFGDSQSWESNLKAAFCFGGMNKGLGEWRTAGKGRFYVNKWEEIG